MEGCQDGCKIGCPHLLIVEAVGEGMSKIAKNLQPLLKENDEFFSRCLISCAAYYAYGGDFGYSKTDALIREEVQKSRRARMAFDEGGVSE